MREQTLLSSTHKTQMHQLTRMVLPSAINATIGVADWQTHAEPGNLPALLMGSLLAACVGTHIKGAAAGKNAVLLVTFPWFLLVYNRTIGTGGSFGGVWVVF